MRLIKKIRNKFAHSLNTSFNDDTISSYCQKLRKPELEISFSNEFQKSNRERFVTNVAFLHGGLEANLTFIRDFVIRGTFLDVFKLHIQLGDLMHGMSSNDE